MLITKVKRKIRYCENIMAIPSDIMLNSSEIVLL